MRRFRAYFFVTSTTTTTTTTMTMIMSTVASVSHVICQFREAGKRTADEEAPPLLPVSRPCFGDCAVDLLVGLTNIVSDFFSLLFDVLNSRFLLYNERFHVLEELSQCHHVFLDLLNGMMPVSNIVGNILGLATSVTGQKLSYGQHTSSLEGDVGITAWLKT